MPDGNDLMLGDYAGPCGGDALVDSDEEAQGDEGGQLQPAVEEGRGDQRGQRTLQLEEYGRTYAIGLKVAL